MSIQFAEKVIEKYSRSTLLPSNRPMDLARYVLNTRYPNGTIHFWRGQWYAYEGGIFSVVDEHALDAELHRVLENTYWEQEKKDGEKVKRIIVPDCYSNKKVAAAMRAVPGVLIPSKQEAHCWIRHSAMGHPADELVVMDKHIFHVKTRTIQPHTPDFFSLSKLPFDHDTQAPTPKNYLAFASQVWPGEDGESRRHLYEEYLGSCIQPARTPQKALWLIGPTGAGKGLCLRLADALIGKENVCGPTLATLANDFGGKCLIGKKLATIGDAVLPSRADKGTLCQLLLSIIGRDKLEINRKGIDMWSGVVDCKFIFASNKILKIQDVSGALAKRLLYLDFEKSFRDVADLDLEARIHAELPGVFNLVLDGLDRLTERGHFIEPPSVARVNAEAMNNPIAAFAEDYLTIDQQATANTTSVYAAFCEWARDSGRDNIPTAQQLGAMLREYVPNLTTKQFRDGANRHCRFYKGIGLSRVCNAATRM